MSTRTIKLCSVVVLFSILCQLVFAADPSLIIKSKDQLHQKLITCDNLEEYTGDCYEEYIEEFKSSPNILGAPSCSKRIPYCFGKRKEFEFIKIHPDIDTCISKFNNGPDCNMTTIYDKCCRLPFQHSGNT